MRTLIVDDSLTIRTLLRRTLGELDQPDVVECANGVEALAQITEQRFDLVVLDQNMPVMSGIETLEAIRASHDYRALPVVVLTSEKNEGLVRRLVELGITDFLLKPLSLEMLADRLAKILTRLRESGATLPRNAAASGRRMLVVEQDPDRRHYLMNALAGHYAVTEVSSAAAALQVCLGPAPPPLDFVLIGQQVGLPPIEMFVAKLRALPHLSGTRLIACVPKGDGEEEPLHSIFDARVERSCVPDVFLADLERIITGKQTPLSRILLLRPSLARDMVSATEQLFGLMLSVEVETSISETRRPHKRADGCVHASVDLTTGNHAVLNLLFRAAPESARAVAGRMIGVPAEEVHDEDILAAAAEIVNIVLGRLRNRLVDAGLSAQIQVPKTWIDPAGSAPVHDGPETIEFRFSTPALDACFDLVLSAAA